MELVGGAQWISVGGRSVLLPAERNSNWKEVRERGYPVQVCIWYLIVGSVFYCLLSLLFCRFYCACEPRGGYRKSA